MGGAIRPTNAPYAEAMRAVADEMDVHLVDLNALSVTMYESMYSNVGESAGIELHYENGQPGGDRTHFNEAGARAFARLVADRLPKELAPYVLAD